MCQGLTILKLPCKNPSKKYNGLCFQHKSQDVKDRLLKKINISNEVIEKLRDEILYLKREIRNSVSLSKFRDLNDNKGLKTEFMYLGRNYKFITYRKEYIDSLNRGKLNDGEYIKDLELKIESLKKKKTFNKKKPKNDNYKVIKKENESLKEAVDTLKKRIKIHSELSEISYKYEIIDSFINKTVEDSTGRIRDYNTGVYNKINDFMKIQDINKICRDSLNLSANEFLEKFKEIRAKRNTICHPVVKSKDNKNILEATKYYMVE